MKLEQLRYLMAIYETGSISKAAKQLYLSQPNISNSIRSLEKELGFNIFLRDAGGVTFTEQGLTLLRHCSSIMKEVDSIQSLSAQEKRRCFHVVAPFYSPVENAFIRLCGEVEKEETGSGKHGGYRFTLVNAYQYESIRMVSQGQADLAFVISGDISSNALKSTLEKHGLSYHYLYRLPCNVNLSAHHPLADDPDFHFWKLRDYPFVEYSFSPENGSPFSHLSDVAFVNLSKLIKVDSRDARSRMIATTSAYGVGVLLPPDRVKELGYRCIPIPGFSLEMGYLKRISCPESELESRFLELLSEEMSFLSEESPQSQDSGS